MNDFPCITDARTNRWTRAAGACFASSFIELELTLARGRVNSAVRHFFLTMARLRILIALILVALIFGISSIAGAQDISPVDRPQVKEAERLADTFVARFRRTMNFGPLWKEYRAEQFGCRLVKSDLITDIADEEKTKLGEPLLEESYIAFMNYFYLKGAHDLSVARMSDEVTEERITPKEIRTAENSSIYTRTNGKTPKTANEIRAEIKQLNRLAALYRKYMPRNAMNSKAWRANNRYLINRGGVTHLGVSTGHPDLCIPDTTKYYLVDRGLFYFYIVEEKGKMKIADLAVDLD